MILRRFFYKAHKRSVVVGACALIVVLGSAALIRRLETATVCTGETRASADEKYSASVMDCSGREFFSDKEVHYFEFRVEGHGFERVITSTPLPGPYFGSRSSTQVIFWRPDSSSVRFVFPTS
jgi:hypothetical protein